MNNAEEKMIARVTWKSEDGFRFMGEAQGHSWDIVSTTPKAIASLDVGAFVWCKKASNEDWGIHLEELTNYPFATEEDWIKQEKSFK